MITRIAVVFLLSFFFAGMPASGQTIKGKSIQTHTIKLSKKAGKGNTESGPGIAFLSDLPYGSSDTITRAFFAFLKAQLQSDCDFITASELVKHLSSLSKYKIVVYHRNKSGPIPAELREAKTLSAFKEYLYEGGSLLLYGFALHYLNMLGLENIQPADSLKPCIDDGYGRKLGFHAFIDHPVFRGMNGGAYILRPLTDQSVGLCGYFGEKLPAAGKVIAVDWDYIFLREESKIVLEYNCGKGKVLAIGGYMDFSQPNLNRLHLEKFTRNCLEYLAGTIQSQDVHYWDYSPNTVLECGRDSLPGQAKLVKPGYRWDEPADPVAMESRFSSNDSWDVAGERLLTMGTGNGGIEELWAHPFMAFRDYEVGIKFDYKDTIYWLKDQRPEVIAHPSYFCRQYKFPRAYLKEIIVNDPLDPAGVLHYEYKGVYGAELFILLKSNLRWMWPYSEKVSGSICHAWLDDIQALRFTDKSGLLNVFLGANKPAVQQISGQFSDFSIDKNYKAVGVHTDKFQAAGFLQYRLEMNDQLDVVYAAGREDSKTIRQCYEKYSASPEEIFQHAIQHTTELYKSRLMISSPDANFNKGYLWAVVSTDKFFVNTPGMGKSMVAGYATTRYGWDGAQKVSGRPGYAWYFGRDGQWSGFALLDAGDYEKVKSELEFYQKYQDLNGKIFHEASTSGIVHYDASDATPLYIILAGRYFRFSNDTAFLRQSWPHILKAIDFCFSTDTDKDHLIENTNVGHGWVEGGELYGSHATFYMTGCWSEALKEASNMAAFMKEQDKDRYRDEAEVINQIINKDFWNPGTSFFNYGKNVDGSFRAEPTVLPAVPLGFGLADPDKAASVLRQYASNLFTTNWGVRIIRDDSRLFKPTGYHYGSVWPLFTGWASMAEYRYGNSVQGFSHMMNNLNVYKSWALGTVEEVLNGAVYKPSGVCANQCWSETMVIQPALEGLLGLYVDAGKRLLKLAPALPAGWDSLEVRNIRIGTKIISMKFKRNGNTFSYRFTSEYREAITVEFAPLLPTGTQLLSCKLNHRDVPFSIENTSKGIRAKLEFKPDGIDLVEIEFRNGINVLPVVTDPKPGNSAEGLRIIDSGLSGNVYSILAENKAGTSGEIMLRVNDQDIDHIDNAVLLTKSGNIYTIRILFPDQGKMFTQVPLKIYLK
ncbi:MAG: GH116 family glycosyl hydrolase [Bacteroidetes bacterium]|nr:GH116 family glycosyl hydrolase [Bacteroidota bacterium]